MEDLSILFYCSPSLNGESKLVSSKVILLSSTSLFKQQESWNILES
jgi:hypothetical protein